jgi:hypothetical protein
MPNRIIRDSCKTSPTLAQLSHGAERLFWRLLTWADDFGRFHGDPRAISGACCPLLSDACEQVVRIWLIELADADLVRFYHSKSPESEISSRCYAFFTTWTKHQRVRASESKFPDPVDSKACGHLTADDGAARSNAAVVGVVVVVGNGVGKDPASPSAPLVCAPDSLPPEVQDPPSVGSGDHSKDHTGKEKKPRASRKNASNANGYSPGFLRFYEADPFKTGPSEPWEIWKTMKLEPLADEIATARAEQAAWPEYSGERLKFLKRAPSWLRKRRWEDKPEPRHGLRESYEQNLKLLDPVSFGIKPREDGK